MAEIFTPSRNQDQEYVSEEYSGITFEPHPEPEGDNLTISQGFIEITNTQFKFQFQVRGENISGSGRNEGAYLNKRIDLSGHKVVSYDLQDLLGAKYYQAYYHPDHKWFYIDFKLSESMPNVGFVMYPEYVNLGARGARGACSLTTG